MDRLVRAAVYLEGSDQLIEVFGECCEAVAGVDHAGGARSGALADVGDLVEIGGDGLGGGGLLGGGSGDLGDHRLHGLGAPDDAGEGVTGGSCGRDAALDVTHAGLHGGDDFVGAVLDGADGGTDLFGGLAGTFGEAADLTGDDGKSAAVFSGSRGLDAGVEGEQAGLVGDIVDDLHDLAYGLAGVPELNDFGGSRLIGNEQRLQGIDRRL